MKEQVTGKDNAIVPEVAVKQSAKKVKHKVAITPKMFDELELIADLNDRDFAEEEKKEEDVTNASFAAQNKADSSISRILPAAKIQTAWPSPANSIPMTSFNRPEFSRK